MSNHVGTTPRLLKYPLRTVTHQWHRPQGIYSSTHHSPDGGHPSENWLSSRCLNMFMSKILTMFCCKSLNDNSLVLLHFFIYSLCLLLYLLVLWMVQWGRFYHPFKCFIQVAPGSSELLIPPRIISIDGFGLALRYGFLHCHLKIFGYNPSYGKILDNSAPEEKICQKSLQKRKILRPLVPPEKRL